MRRYFEEKLGYKPRLAVWEITLACNSKCLHCGSFAGRPRDDELTTAECLRVIRELAELGCERMTLSGGEPLLRPDWHILGRAIAEHGMAVGMISNGLAFDNDAAKKALDFGVDGISFSIDGLKENHERIRSVKNSFGKVMGAVDIATKNGIAACVVSHVNHWNIKELHSMHRMFGEAGVRTWKVQLSNPAGEMAASREMVLGPADLLHLLPTLVDIRQLGLPFLEISDSLGYYGPYERILRKTWRKELPFWTGCGAGLRVIGIESNGNIKGCLALPSQRHGSTEFVEGNIRARSLADIWNDPGGFAYNRAFTVDMLQGFCRTCEYGEICRAGCHWTALSHCGTYLENKLCYHRVTNLQKRIEKKSGWLPSCIAPAVLMATLGFGGCYGSSGMNDNLDASQDTTGEVEDGDASVQDGREDGTETVPDVTPDPTADPTADPVADVVPDTAEDPAAEEIPEYCPTTREELCCFICEGQTYWLDGYANCEAVEASCMDDYAGPVPIPADCPDPCCPTAEEACCFCLYDGPAPIPEQCDDPCEPPIDSLYADTPPIPVPVDPDPDAGTDDDA